MQRCIEFPDYYKTNTITHPLSPLENKDSHFTGVWCMKPIILYLNVWCKLLPIVSLSIEENGVICQIDVSPVILIKFFFCYIFYLHMHLERVTYRCA